MIGLLPPNSDLVYFWCSGQAKTQYLIVGRYLVGLLIVMI